MATSDYERARSQDYIDRHPTRYDASGWGAVLSVIALMLILGMLFIGFTSTPPATTTNQPTTTIERTTPAPTTAPTPTPAPPATAPN
jgi:hypothetical protein